MKDIVHSYDNMSNSTTINYFEDKVGRNYVSAEDMIQQIQAVCQKMDKVKLGLIADRVRTYSIQINSAMKLHLAGVKDNIIMLQGRWRSIFFLNYIRLQIQEL